MKINQATLVVSMALALSACGGDSGGGNSSTEGGNSSVISVDHYGSSYALLSSDSDKDVSIGLVGAGVGQVLVREKGLNYRGFFTYDPAHTQLNIKVPVFKTGSQNAQMLSITLDKILKSKGDSSISNLGSLSLDSGLSIEGHFLSNVPEEQSKKFDLGSIPAYQGYDSENTNNEFSYNAGKVSAVVDGCTYTANINGPVMIDPNGSDYMTAHAGSIKVTSSTCGDIDDHSVGHLIYSSMQLPDFDLPDFEILEYSNSMTFYILEFSTQYGMKQVTLGE
ncbi:hypothetical protein BCT86_18235 [Vibrio breoganii]|uniref:Lipoprotein n=2 Tax=Vibrio breoganii TaxID=553239 RepID=A0AAP8MWC1_9VIBR|nr:hypothetical protein [Vibrio breoganii]OCH76792.1 hypothetical protein A6D95_08210 [Vibrio breoganii]PMG98489.1 hypothetical protein BCU79_04065 [Vibrio breoganii]PMI19810.1 hypothetical protein BCU49_08815 [Vibrio breoganii]PMJ46667.1 hypothetical protein BCU21_09800 [Vibrio breoganii]PMK32398.1 hypothetical protein BCU06_15325 [Vibrio breoganii]